MVNRKPAEHWLSAKACAAREIHAQMTFAAHDADNYGYVEGALRLIRMAAEDMHDAEARTQN